MHNILGVFCFFLCGSISILDLVLEGSAFTILRLGGFTIQVVIGASIYA